MLNLDIVPPEREPLRLGEAGTGRPAVMAPFGREPKENTVFQLLSGVRVVEGASFIAGPYCTLLLSQLGAEVIRFDPIGGGPDFRRWPLTGDGDSLYWEGLNKGKKSVALNLSDPEGRELAVALATAPGEGAGLFVTNYPERGFLAHERLSARRPDLLTVRIQGRADGGSALDYTVNCAVGMPYMTGPADRSEVPVNHVLPAWDLLAGATAAVALQAALDHRRRTGVGQEIRVPLGDVAAATLGNLGQVAEVTVSGQDRPKYGNSLFGAFGRDFLTRDGSRLMVVAITAKQWEGLVSSLDLADAVGRLEAELGTSFKTDEGNRFRHRDRLDPLVEQAIGALPLETVVARFDAAGVCYGPYRTLREAVAVDPAFAPATSVFADTAHPSGYSYPTPGFAAYCGATPRTAPAAAPRLGQHTEEVLGCVLSLPDHAIADLHDRGIVRIAAP